MCVELSALWLVPDASVRLVAALVVGLGLSVGGYVALMDPSWGIAGFLLPLALVLVCSGGLALWAVRGGARGPAERTRAEPATGWHKAGWMLLGVAIGIKLFAVFAVLPQYLLAKSGTLPGWYGCLVGLNAIVIVLLQKPVMTWITGRGTEATRTRAVLVALACCMIVLAVPGWFHVERPAGALTWILLCSVVECAAGYLDVAASGAGCLFHKEAAAGLGAGLCVALSRAAGGSRTRAETSLAVV
ncbi:hypothetical protein [Streptomyces sp. NPDC002537]